MIVKRIIIEILNVIYLMKYLNKMYNLIQQ